MKSDLRWGQTEKSEVNSALSLKTFELKYSRKKGE